MLHQHWKQIKHNLEAHGFKTCINLETAVKRRLKARDTDSYIQGTENLIPWYDKYVSPHEDYAGK